MPEQKKKVDGEALRRIEDAERSGASRLDKNERKHLQIVKQRNERADPRQTEGRRVKRPPRSK